MTAYPLPRCGRYDLPGACKVCGALGGFGFQPPGPRSQRKEHWIAWACADHRAEVEAQWRGHLGLDRKQGKEKGGKQSGGNGSELPDSSPDAGQGELF